MVDKGSCDADAMSLLSRSSSSVTLGMLILAPKPSTVD